MKPEKIVELIKWVSENGNIHEETKAIIIKFLSDELLRDLGIEPPKRITKNALEEKIEPPVFESTEEKLPELAKEKKMKCPKCGKFECNH